MKVCGDNSHLLLSKNTNNQSAYGSPVISPPADSEIDPLSLLSYSIYFGHSVMITRDGKAYGIGDNRDERISGSLPKEILFNFTEFSLKDGQGLALNPESAVCGYKYTLYIVSNPENTNDKKLAYSSNTTKSEFPVILNTGKSVPVSLYGGRLDSAAIDSDGGIIFVPGGLEAASSALVASFLPEGQKAVCVCCCDKFVFALSSSGRVFTSPSSVKLHFIEVPELKGVRVTGISGTWYHCLAVCDDGRVFGRGENYCGQLALGERVREVDEFKEVWSLGERKIRAAFAGATHSIFVEDDGGRIFACGSNFYGQLLLETGPSQSKSFEPVEVTTIESGAPFCITGDSISAVFTGQVPPNCPNMILKSL